MTYRLRLESNAFTADSAIGKLLDTLSRFSKQARRVAGIKVQEFEGNQLRQLRGISVRTFATAMDWADSDFDQQITSPKWQWKGAGGATKRKNGEVVTEPRDIVDLGVLLQSKTRNDISNSVTEFVWDAPHAGGVHDGYTSRRGGSYPARPWTEETLSDIDEVIQQILNQEAK